MDATLAANADMARYSALALLVMLYLPGAVLLKATTRTLSLSPLTLLACLPGLSVGLITLISLWCWQLGLAIRPPIPLLLLISCLLAALWFFTRIRFQRPGWVGILLTVLTLLTLWLRFEQIQGLAMPAWVDSLHHALLIRVAAETGQPPLNLNPYLQVTRLTYHWGYHVVSALTLQATAARVPDAIPLTMLWQGQLIGTLALPLYAGLATSLWRKPAAGIIAGVIVGFVSVMPGYYLSWGRYTLLLGMVLLPSALLLLQLAIQHHTPGMLIAAALAFCALGLVHFVVFIFAAVWALAAWLVGTGQQQHPAPTTHYQRLAVPLVVGSSLVLIAPWLLVLLQQARPQSGAAATNIVGNASYNMLPTELLWTNTNVWLLGLAALGGLFLISRRDRCSAILLLWMLGVVLLANPPLIGLPYLSFVTNETMVICLFAPVALLIGGASARLLHEALQHWPGHTRLVYGLSMLVLVGAVGWGLREYRSIIRQDTILATSDDQAMITWIAANTPPDAHILVNTTGWLAAVDRGSDGGWWLLPLAGRQVSTPPVLYTYGEPADVARIQRISGWMRTHQNASAQEMSVFMLANGYTYLYATSGGQPLDPAKLRQWPLFEEVHQVGKVSVFRLR